MMTYRGFHLRWTIPLSIVCMIVWLASGSPTQALMTIFGLCVVVVAFTFPWDNWAVSKGIWDFPADRVLFRIRHLPIEEIFFFVVQTIQVGLLTAALSAYFPVVAADEADLRVASLIVLGGICTVWFGLWFSTRRWRHSNTAVTYAWHLLYWFLPIIAMQWTFGWPILAPRIVTMLAASLFVGTILVFSDLWAVRRGIWYFDERMITGHKAARVLPWEEIAFFYVTSILVSQSTLLLLSSSAR
ncbi:MAG TPA: lycopene cyclase domain-containing protein [Candidatus Didemnitutus sp.]|nr:lycopene cyclase domain-containing protein [Candidatus Didemnitutus sp.]